MKVYLDISQAYLGTLEDVYYNYDYKASPRGMTVREKLNYTFKVLNPTDEPIKTKDEERNRVISAYTIKEKALYESGSNKAEDFGAASKFWLSIANPDNTINSAYGHLIWHKQSHGSDFEQKLTKISGPDHPDDGSLWAYTSVRRTPWQWAKQCLIDDKDTRQAILRFSLPEHQWLGNKDQTCTMHGLFLIRDNKLNLSIVMRSNDLVKGLTYDLPWFCSLIDKMIDELKPYYNDLTKGSYTHTVHSIHVYEKDEEKIKAMLGDTDNFSKI